MADRIDSCFDSRVAHRAITACVEVVGFGPQPGGGDSDDGPVE
jgi:hypothetical protein